MQSARAATQTEILPAAIKMVYPCTKVLPDVIGLPLGSKFRPGPCLSINAKLIAKIGYSRGLYEFHDPVSEKIDTVIFRYGGGDYLEYDGQGSSQITETIYAEQTWISDEVKSLLNSF